MGWSDDDEWGDDPSSKQAPVPPAAKKETPAGSKTAAAPAAPAKKAADEADWDDDDWEAPAVPEEPAKEKTVGKAVPKPEEGKGKGKGKKGKGKGKGKGEEQEEKAPAMPGDCYVCGKQLDEHPSRKYCSAAPKPMTKEEYWAKENAKTFAALGGDDEWDDDY